MTPPAPRCFHFSFACETAKVQGSLGDLPETVELIDTVRSSHILGLWPPNAVFLHPGPFGKANSQWWRVCVLAVCQALCCAFRVLFLSGLPRMALHHGCCLLHLPAGGTGPESFSTCSGAQHCLGVFLVCLLLVPFISLIFC